MRAARIRLAYVAGAKMVWNGKAAREKQAALDGNSATPTEQRSLQDQIRRAGDRAVMQLVPQPNETVNQFISRQATTRAHAEAEVRRKWLQSTRPQQSSQRWGK
jgi:hypothetical protein